MLEVGRCGRGGGDTCVGSARVVDGHGEKPPPPDTASMPPPAVQPARRNEAACRDTPSVDREEGWVGGGCVVSPWYVVTRAHV
jgi:hypothetical protein